MQNWQLIVFIALPFFVCLVLLGTLLITKQRSSGIQERHPSRSRPARRKSHDDINQQAEQLRIINRISLAIAEGLNMDRVLRTLREQCSQVAPLDVFYVALYDEATGLIQIPLYYEKGYQEVQTRDIFSKPGLTGYVIDTKHTLYIKDTLDSRNKPATQMLRLGGTPARSYVGIPLILRNRVIGVISIQSYKVNAYTNRDIRMLETIAIHAAIAIENARLYAEVQRLAIIDELTGLYNYRGLRELGNREVYRAHRFNHPLTAMFIDVDNLKDFNDHYSHATGNQILRGVAQRCLSGMRSVDLVARYGGDEFVILLPETDLATAERAAKRLHRLINSLLISTRYGNLGITVSIGVAELTRTMKDVFILIDRANQAEHRAKEKGRNCVVVEGNR